MLLFGFLAHGLLDVSVPGDTVTLFLEFIMANREIPGTEYAPPIVANLSEATAIKIALTQYVFSLDRQCKKYELGSPVRLALEEEKSKIQSLASRFGG